MFYDTRNPFGIVSATIQYNTFFKTLILDASSCVGGIYGGIIIIDPGSSSSSSGGGGSTGAFFLRLPERFPINEPDGYGCNLTIGINGTRSTSSTTSTCGGTYPAVSSIMGVGDVVATPDSATVLVLEFEITILCEKLTSALAVVDGNLLLKCSGMN